MDYKLDQGGKLPLYRQVANIIRGCVDSGEFERDMQIPTEAELSKRFGISRVTVRKALEELTDDGILVRRQGKGTFVAPGNAMSNVYPFTSFDDACIAAGKTPKTMLLSYSMEFPSQSIASFLGLDEHSQIIQISRLRNADDVPVILETDYFPMSFSFLSEGPLIESIGNILQKHGIYAEHGESKTTICFATAEESRLFGIEPETPLLYIYSKIKDQNNRPIQIAKQIIRADVFHLIHIF